MRSLFAICFILLLSFPALTQGFDHIFDFGSEDPNEAKSIEVYDEKVYVISWSSSYLGITVFDQDSGEQVSQLLTDLPMYIGYYAGTSIDSEGNIFVPGRHWETYGPMICKISPDLELEYSTTYTLLPDTLWHTSHACEVYENKLFVLIETTYLEDTPLDPDDGEGRYPGIIVTDLEGNLLEGPYWIDIYDTDDVMRQLHVSENGIFMGGGNHALTFSGDDWDPFVIKMNFDGSLAWSVEIDEENVENNYDNWGAAIQEHPDGSIYVGSFFNPQWPDGQAGKVSLSKISANGFLEWTKTYGDDGWFVEFSEILLLDDGIYGVGGHAAEGWVTEGLLMKMDFEGDSLWSRSYYSLPQDGETDFRLRDVKQLDDGGFAAAGYVIGANHQDSYVVRTDSEGCIIPGCGVGLQELGGLASEVSVYPNPATENFTVTSKAHLSKVTISDALGHTVIAESCAGDSHRIDVSSIAHGIYTVVVSFKDQHAVVRKRLVVE